MFIALINLNCILIVNHYNFFAIFLDMGLCYCFFFIIFYITYLTLYYTLLDI